MVRYLIFQFLILLSIAGKAQQKQFLFSNVNNTKGLAHNRVTAFLRDSKGFIWIGTYEGLSRFDGYSFKNFISNPNDTNSLRDNLISSLFEDQNGKIWIAAGNYLDIFDPLTETFNHSQSLFGGRVDVPIGSRGFQQFDPKGNIIYCNNRTGLFKYFVGSDSLIKIDIPYNDSSLLIINMNVDNNGDVWYINKTATLYKISSSSLKITDSLKLKQNTDIFYDIYFDKDNDIWLFDRNNSSGVMHYNNKTKQLNHYSTTSETLKLSNNYVTCITEDNNGFIWIGTDHGGINIIDKKTWKINYLHNEPFNSRSIAENAITSLYRDKLGFVWIGTFKNGFSYYHNYLYNFSYYNVSIEDVKDKSFNDIDNFAENKKGDLYLGTNGGGLIYFDRKQNTFKQYKHNPQDPYSISADIIVGMYIDKKDRLWVGTYLGGLNMFDGKRFYHFINKPGDLSSLSDNRVWDICEDSKGMLWIVTLLGGVDVFNSKTGKVEELFNGLSDSSINSNVVFTVIEGKDNTMWFGTMDGMRAYNRITKKFTYFSHIENDPNSLSKNIVYTVLEDSRGLIWAATTDGLNLYDKKSNTFKIFRKENGLPSNLILTLLEDDFHNIWMSTSNGLSKLIVKHDTASSNYSFEFKNYDFFDGLQGNEFNQQAAFKTSSGEIIFGGPNGFNIFNPNDIETKNLPSNVVLTDLQIFNQSLSVNKEFNRRIILRKSITYTKELELKYDENVFTLEFSNVNFLHPERVKYKYMLENFNNNWFEVESNNRRVTYTNLNPGTYFFKVKSTLNDGTWSDEVATLRITIMPPWWATLWFKIFALISFAGILTGFYYYRMYALRKQKTILESKVKKRTNELSEANYLLAERQEEIITQNTELEQHRNHLENLVNERTKALETALSHAKESDRLKSAFLANMSHEIRTPMNAIVGFSNLLTDPDLSFEERNDMIQLINTNSDALLMLIDDILDISLIEANQLVIRKEPFYLNEIVDHIYSFYTLINKNLNLSILLNNTIKSRNLKLFTDKHRLRQIILNLMNNACKFTKLGFVELGLTIDQTYLTIYVKDTGVGINSQNLKLLFERFRKLSEEKKGNIIRGIGLGLAISKQVTELIGGNLTVESIEDKGSTFAFTIELKDILTDDSIKVPSEKPFNSTKWNNKSILIVEDEEANYLYFKKVLEKTNTKIVWAVNGSEAIKYIDKGQLFNLVLMDIKMPQMDGFEATQILKQKYPNLLIIAQTAYARPEDKIRFQSAGFDDYITKPIKPKDLLELIEKYL